MEGLLSSDPILSGRSNNDFISGEVGEYRTHTPKGFPTSKLTSCFSPWEIGAPLQGEAYITDLRVGQGNADKHVAIELQRTYRLILCGYEAKAGVNSAKHSISKPSGR